MIYKKIIFLIAVLLSATNYCFAQELEEIVAEGNSRLPMSMGDEGEIHSCTIENGDVVMTCILNEQVIDGIDTEKDKRKIIKRFRINVRFGSGIKKLFQAIKERQCGFVMKYIGETSAKTGYIRLSTEDVASIVDDRDTLEDLVAERNSYCPNSFGAKGELNSYAIEDGDVVMTFILDERFANFDEMDEENMKKALIIGFRSNDGGDSILFKAIKERQCGLVVKYKGKTSAKTLTIRLSTEDIASIIDNNPTETLAAMVESSNAQYPLNMNDFFTMRKVTLEENFLVYNVTVDETIENVSVANLENGKSTVKEGIIKSFLSGEDPTFDVVANLCLKCNRGIAYRYEGSVTSAVCEIEIPLSELQLLCSKKQINQ